MTPDPITHLGDLEEITIESDERGWELHFVSTEHGRFIANIHMVATDLLEQVRPIDHWLEEGRAAAASHVPNFVEDGYYRSDPKHPEYHSTHADIWDNRDKTAR